MIVRFGKITKVDPKGKVQVFYEDTGNTTLMLPLLSFGEEYKLPSVGEMVLVLHKENSPSSGVVLGTFWSDSHVPDSSTAYSKEFTSESGMKIEDDKLVIYAPKVEIQTDTGTINMSDLIGG